MTNTFTFAFSLQSANVCLSGSINLQISFSLVFVGKHQNKRIQRRRLPPRLRRAVEKWWNADCDVEMLQRVVPSEQLHVSRFCSMSLSLALLTRTASPRCYVR